MYRVGAPPPLALYLGGPFPPTGPIPRLDAVGRRECAKVARGQPGDPVVPGVFPRAACKLARLALAAEGDFDVPRLRAVAWRSTDRTRAYAAHDALACALVHPQLSNERGRLADHVLSERGPGRRARRKRWRIVRWAIDAGYLDPATIAPMHVPALRRAAAAREATRRELAQRSSWAVRDALDAFLVLRPRWWRMREEVLRNETPYVDLAVLGHALFRAKASGCRKPFVDEFFTTIETALARGDDDVHGLIVVGLFEALQNDAYRRGPADLIEAALGPRSLSAWSDLIDAWTGRRGIRTVDAWRRILSIAPSRVSRTVGDDVEVLEWRESRVVLATAAGERTLDADEVARVAAQHDVWLADAERPRPRPTPTVDATFRIERARSAQVVTVAGDLACCDDRWFAITPPYWPTF